MMKDEIIVLGLLSDETFIRRYKQVRRVVWPDGLFETLTAGMGMGGGVTPKIMVYETDCDKPAEREDGVRTSL